MNDDTRDFYDALAPDYVGLFPDWEASMTRHGEVVEALIDGALGTGEAARARLVLDVSSGIGTQALGLARRGHQVLGRDLSPEMIARGRDVAARLGVALTLEVGDMRRARAEDAGRHDAVIAMDNSLPHLDRDEEIEQVFRSMLLALRPGGVALVSTRDYDSVLARPPAQRPRFDPLRLHTPPAGPRRISFQLWDWDDDDRYTLHLVMLDEREGGWPSVTRRARYRAISRATLTRLARAAGLREVEWLMPSESGFFQPVLRARRA
ncbi:MAG: class I SAM-dependent methyltransferase [Myxococcales bacterium]|nr:class I SAM-dependent methyltransferase [Myxococcales bacterium]MCB9755994.1 class I SAM-dependent methyltransferase [Myxococcales bacterium]